MKKKLSPTLTLFYSDNFPKIFNSTSKKRYEITLGIGGNIGNTKDLFDKLENLTKDSLINNHIKYKFEIDDCKISGNENLLIQALINIFNNAKDALVEKPNQYEDRLFFIFVKKDKNSLQIKIRDNAGGIKDSIIDKIFDPYFTTKHKSVGTGIGLYMSNQIITKQFKGSITINNLEFIENGKNYIGAEFTVILPNISK